MKIEVELDGNTMSMNFDPHHPVRLQDLLCKLEREILVQVIMMRGGVKARAAEALSLNRTTLVEKAKKYEIEIKL